MSDETNPTQFNAPIHDEEPFKLNDMVIEMMQTEDRDLLKKQVAAARDEGLTAQVLEDIPDEVITPQKRLELETLLDSIEIRAGYKDGYVGGDAKRTAQDFENVFHPVSVPVESLNLETLPIGCSVLDVGSGKGDVVAYLNALGHRAVGVDLGAGPDIAQNPEYVASSMHLPFPDKSFDVITSHWGGLNYPILYLRSENEHQEYVKTIIVAHLKQLSEAIRVSKNEVRIAPWCLDGFMDAAGLMAIPIEGWDYIFPAIDYSKLFEEMHIDYRTIAKIPLDLLEADPWQCIALDVQNANMEPLNKLIEKIEGSTLPVAYKFKSFYDTDPDFSEAFRSLSTAKRTLHARGT